MLDLWLSFAMGASQKLKLRLIIRASKLRLRVSETAKTAEREVCIWPSDNDRLLAGRRRSRRRRRRPQPLAVSSVVREAT